MLLYFHSDLIKYIAKYLCFIDTLALRYTCKSLYSTPQPDFRTIFLKRVAPFVHEPESFCRLLYQDGAYVSGSFILDCLYNTYTHNDIDIYYQDMGELYHLGKLDFKDHLLGKGYHQQYDDHSGITNLSIIDQTGVPPDEQTYPLQLIPILGGRKAISQFIWKTFDMDLLKNYFDGQELRVANYSTKFSRSDFIKPNFYILMKTYDIHTKCDQIVHNWQCKCGVISRGITKKRIKKYNQRGFHVTKHPKYRELFMEYAQIIHDVDLGDAMGAFDTRWLSPLPPAGD